MGLVIEKDEDFESYEQIKAIARNVKSYMTRKDRAEDFIPTENIVQIESTI